MGQTYGAKAAHTLCAQECCKYIAFLHTALTAFVHTAGYAQLKSPALINLVDAVKYKSQFYR